MKSLKLLALCLVSVAPAQTPANVSPAAALTGVGNASNHIPFSFSPFPVGYQQVHSLSSFSNQAPAIVQQMRFRMQSGSVNRPGQTIDVELFMARCPHDAEAASGTYANNIVPGSEVNVFTRKMVLLPTMPDNRWGVAPFPFDTQFLFTGTHLSWRANVYGNSNNNQTFNYPIDTWWGIGVSSANGATPGCRSATGTANATHTVQGIGLMLGAATVFVGNSFVVAGGLPALLSIGPSNTNFGGLPLPFDLAVAGAPGCFVLNDVLLLFGGTTTAGANGQVMIRVNVPFDPSLIGGQFYSQFFFVEAAANPLGVFATDGRTCLIGKPPGVARIYSLGSVGGPSGTLGLQFAMAIGLD